MSRPSVSSPRFSILLPSFRRRYLAECISSILSQTFGDFELVVVDDASPEDLSSVVESFKDPRIRYSRNDVGCGAEHLVANWNICLGLARGEYVLNMGDDDLLEPCCLELYNDLLERFPHRDVYHIRTTVIDETGAATALLEKRPETEDVYEMIAARFSGRPQMIGDYLFRREALVAAGGFYDLPYAWGADDVTVFRAAAHGGIANGNTPGFRYRRFSGSITGSVTNAEGKLYATRLYREWMQVFLRTPSSGDGQEAVRKRLLRAEKAFFRRQRIYFLSRDSVHGCSWWRSRKEEFALSGMDILRARLKKWIHQR